MPPHKLNFRQFFGKSEIIIRAITKYFIRHRSSKKCSYSKNEFSHTETFDFQRKTLILNKN